MFLFVFVMVYDVCVCVCVYVLSSLAIISLYKIGLFCVPVCVCHGL